MGPDSHSREDSLEEDLERGFLTQGLFGRSRHPNYFGELGFWWTLYSLGCSAAAYSSTAAE